MSEFMFDESDNLFAPDDDVEVESGLEAWKILIIDDEEDVHSVTRLVLSDFVFDDKPLTFLDAYSGAEAYTMMQQHPDIAVALVDVVMETDHAGLELVKRIREELENKSVRLVLRTGQPGQAPEKKVISIYDINDYKNKTELTDTKMHTLLYATLRSYRDIITLQKNRAGLEEVIRSSATIFELGQLSAFASAVLSQLISLLGLGEAAHLKVLSGIAVESSNNDFTVRAGVGRYADAIGHRLPDELKTDILPILKQSIREHRNIYLENCMVAYFGESDGGANLLYINGTTHLSDMDKHLIDLFCANVSIAFDNAYLQQEIEDTQSEVINLLGEAVENRSNETGFHVKRVAEMSKLLALKYGLDEQQAEVIRRASPLHDLGKIAIPDAVLHKEGPHDDKERAVMESHVDIGFNMLKQSRREVLKCAALIAGQHHEKWDGSGYPKGLKGEQIHIVGRITAVADVFDALINPRCYKAAWPLEDVIALFNAEKGKHFDPDLVDTLLENMDAFMRIQTRYQVPA